MKKFVLLYAVLTAVFFIAGTSQAALIDFDSFAAWTNINGVNLGGVTITAPNGAVYIYNNYDILSISPSNVVVASNWTEGLTLRLTFASPTTFVSIYGGDGGYDTDRFSMTAYNSSNTQIAFADTGPFNGPDTLHPVSGATMGDYRYLSVSAADIKSVVLTQVNWGVGFDNLTYNAVPLPPSLMLMAPGLLGLIGLKRKYLG
jgi:hypothetical protein